MASGAVAGLVAITPACAFIAPWAAIVLGLLAGGLCCCAIGLKHKLGFDDAGSDTEPETVTGTR